MVEWQRLRLKTSYEKPNNQKLPTITSFNNNKGMIIIAIIGLVVMGIVLGRMCFPNCGHWDYDIKAGKLTSLETRVFMLEKENERLNYIINSHNGIKRMFEENYYAHCRVCERKFYSRDQKDEDVAQMLTDINVKSEKIADKLGFEIKNI